MDNEYFKGEDSLKEALKKIDNIFGIERVINENMDQSKVQKYYNDSHPGYTFVHSNEGAVHMSLNYDGIFNKDGYYQQLREINEYIYPNAQILELACGKGFNSSYLATKNPSARFFGIDISQKHLKYARRRAKEFENLNLDFGDFHTLEFEDDIFDVIFELESVCHATNPEKVFKEAARVLKKGGKFILYDGFRTEDFENLSETQRTTALLVEKAMALNKFYTPSEWMEAATSGGFEITQNDDISTAIFPNCKRLHRIARKYMKYPAISKLTLALLPESLLINSIAGLLLPYSITQNIQTYNRVVLTKK